MSSSSNKRKIWTDAEDEMILAGMRKYGEKWSKIRAECPEVVANHPSVTSVQDRVKTLRKQLGEQGFGKRLKGGWSPEEDEALKDAYASFWCDWEKIVEVYANRGKKKLEYRDAKEVQERVKWLKEQGSTDVRLRREIKEVKEEQKEIVEQEISVTELPLSKSNKKPREQNIKQDKIPKEDVNTTLDFVCECGKTHTARSMLMEGIRCECKRSIKEMLGQLEQRYTWVVYIVLAKGSENLESVVEYVGVSENVKKRIASHQKEVVKNVTFDMLRISVILGENEVIKILRPRLNDYKTGGKEESGLVRLRDENKIFRGVNAMGSMYRDIINDHSKTKKLYESMVYSSMVGNIHSCVWRSTDINEGFCFLQKDEDCVCEPRCCYRKIFNHFRKREMWDGIPATAVREGVSGYRYKEIVRVVKGEGELNPIWSLEYCQRVLLRMKTRVVDEDTGEVLREGIQEDTVKKYEYGVKSMWEKGIMQVFDEPLECLRLLRGRFEQSTVNSLVWSTIMSLLSHMTNQELIKMFGSIGPQLRYAYWQISNDLRAKSEKDSQTRGAREERNWLSVSEIEEAIYQMAKECQSLYEYQRVIWYRLELEQGTWRNEYSTLKVQNYNTKKDNWIDIDKKIITLNSYKTASTYHQQTFPIVESLVEELKKLVECRLRDGHEYLFVNTMGQQFIGAAFSNFMIGGFAKYVGGRRIGSQMLRKIVVTEMRKGEKSLEEKREMSKNMLHSEHMSERYRRIF